MRLPVVAWNASGGALNLVRDGVDGLIVDSDSPERWRPALASLMGNDAARRAMAARAPEVVTRVSIESALEMWMRCWEMWSAFG